MIFFISLFLNISQFVMVSLPGNDIVVVSEIYCYHRQNVVIENASKCYIRNDLNSDTAFFVHVCIFSVSHDYFNPCHAINKLRCHTHFQMSANQIALSRLLIQIHKQMTDSADLDRLASSEAN